MAIPKLPNGKDMKKNKVYDSTRKGKKKMVYACKNNQCKLLHFGAVGYSDYTKHKDPKRRENYRARHKAIKDKHGKPAYKNKLSPAYWAYNFLW